MTKVHKVTFRIAFERDDVKPYSEDEAKAPEERIVGDCRQAAEIAVGMANQPRVSGGSVIISVRRLGTPIYLTLVEPGASIDWVEREVREKSTRQVV